MQVEKLEFLRQKIETVQGIRGKVIVVLKSSYKLIG